MERKKEFYKWIKISGMLMFIPLVWTTNVFLGYAIGKYWPGNSAGHFSGLIWCVLGSILLSIWETIRIIRLVVKAEKSK